jgi:polysaccharide biosynthesis protein PelC
MKSEDNRIMKAAAPFLVFALALPSVACRSTSTKYVHPNADLGAITKVAVLPFENLTSERAAADKVQKIFYLELLTLQVFDVAEPGQVAKTLRGGGVTSTEALGLSDLQRIGKELGVDGLFVGSVVDYADTRTGTTPTPEVTIEVRLVETQSGSTIWSTSHTRAGAGVSTRLFGLGGESLTEAARKVVRRELATLLK